jgi:hypothetical protein
MSKIIAEQGTKEARMTERKANKDTTKYNSLLMKSLLKEC